MAARNIQKIPGLNPDAARVLLEAFNGLVAEVNRLAQAPRVTGLQRGGYVASGGETVRMRGGERLTLPRARAENAGTRVHVILETSGILEVVAHQGKVDGLALQELSTIGLYVFQSNGVSGWFCSGSELRGRFIVGDPGTEDGGIVIQGSTFDSLLKVSDIGASNEAMFILHRHATAQGPVFITARSNSDTAAHGTVTSGQDLGTWYAVGWDGVDYAYGGYLAFIVDGTPGSNDMPCRFVIATTADGAASATERLRIASTGAWGLAGANYGTAGQVFNSNGSAGPPTWGSTVAGDDVVLTAVDDLLASAGDIVQFTAGAGINLVPTSQVLVAGSGVLQLGTGATEGYLVVEGGALADIPAVGAGDGLFSVEDDGVDPTRPIFTDDTDADHVLAYVDETTRILEIRYLDTADASISESVPAGCTWFEFECCGGGGGGGGADADTVKRSSAGGGGAAGGWHRHRLAVVSGTITGSVGAGGTAGSNTGGNGGNGGDTVLTYNSVSYTAQGGNGGLGNSAGPNANSQVNFSFGGASGLGDAACTETARGQEGFPGIMFSVSANPNAACGGNGGASFFGGGGRGGQTNVDSGTSNGRDGEAPGSGGGGGARTSTGIASAGATGGVGAPGMMKITFYSGTMPTEAAIN